MKKNNLKKALPGLIVASGILLSSTVIQAAQISAPLDVSASVAGGCIVEVDPVNFGQIVGDIDVAGSSNITINCTAGVPYSIALDGGQGFDGVSRSISGSGSDPIPYYIAKPGDIAEWGDVDFDGFYPNGDSYTNSGTGADQILAFDLLLESTAAGILTPGDVLSDTVTVTLYF